MGHPRGVWLVFTAMVVWLILLRYYRRRQMLWCQQHPRAPGVAEGFSAAGPVRYPDCAAASGDASCTPGGFTVPGVKYTLPDGRCVKAKTECAGCLDAIVADKAWVDPEAFESCDAGTNTTVLPDTPFGCSDYAMRYPELMGSVVETGKCGALKRHFVEIGRAEGKVAPVVDMNGPQVLYPYCKPDCVKADGGQRIGTRYWLSKTNRCVRAIGECTDCLDRENKTEQMTLTTQSRNALASCATEQDTTNIIGAAIWQGKTGNARPATPRVHCNTYLGRYPEVLALFGTDCAAAQRHYEGAGFQEGRNPNPDPMYNVWPMCKETGDCIVNGGIRKDVMYRIPRNRCVISRTTEEARLQHLVRWGDASPYFSDGSFVSCEAGRNTMQEPPIVQWPGCKNAATPCVHASGQQIDGQRYRMPNGRCLRAKGVCAGCLESEGNPNRESLQSGYEVHFESCHPSKDTTVYFDCGSYLSRNADVFQSPFGEVCETAKTHYRDAGAAEGRDASRDPMLNVYPHCMNTPENSCKNGLTLGAQYRFGMNRDKCAIARTTDVNKLSMMSYSPFSTFRTDGSFDSCEPGRDTRV